MPSACRRSVDDPGRRDLATRRAELRALLVEIAPPSSRPGPDAPSDLPFGLLHALAAWRPAAAR